MDKDERLNVQFDFLEEIDKEKEIYRQTYIADGTRKENDAEHAWHMAIMALLLQEYSSGALDMLRVISMILIHDVVEIDAGDTYAYDANGQLDQAEREQKAADRIFGLLPEDQARRFLNLWKEFEAGETAESKYARSMDRLQPMMLNAVSGGKSWSEHDVKLSQILKRNNHTAEDTKELWEYCFKRYVKPNIENHSIENN